MTHKAGKWLLCSLQATQALISMRVRACWSGPLLPSYRINGYYSIWQPTQNVQIRLHGCVRLSNKLKMIAFGYKEHSTDYKWESRFYWNSSLAVMKVETLLTPSNVYMWRTPFSNIPQRANWSQRKCNLICTTVMYGETFYRRHTTDQEMEVSVLLRLFISSKEFFNTAYAL